jgi:hypothetical protein
VLIVPCYLPIIAKYPIKEETVNANNARLIRTPKCAISNGCNPNATPINAIKNNTDIANNIILLAMILLFMITLFINSEIVIPTANIAFLPKFVIKY